MNATRLLRAAPRTGLRWKLGKRTFGSSLATRNVSTPMATTEPQFPRDKPPVRQPPMADSVHFPGALNSKFTSELTFTNPETHPTLPTFRIMNAEGEIISPEHFPQLDKDVLLNMYKAMLNTSLMDILMFDSQRQGRISFYMVSAGEEGTAVGSAAALDPRDVVFSQYREQGVLMYRGFTWTEFMSQMFATKSDSAKGRNMPIHYLSERLHVHPISSPLGTQLPHAVGAAYALKRDGEGRVAVCYFGEGAASEGDFHAALNMAATRACPVVFVCRNNGYAISTPSLEQYRGDGIASRGIGYGIETVRVDGNDIFAVYTATKHARAIAASQGRPVLIEAMTYRVSHHSTSDDSFAYRARAEVEAWKRRDDPITRLRKYLEAQGLWNAELEDKTRKDVRKEILEAFGRAEREKKPAVREMFLDTFKEETPELRRQREELRDVVERWGNEYDLSGYDEGKEGL